MLPALIGPLAAGLIFGAWSTDTGVTIAYAVDALLFTVSFWATYRLPPIPPVHDETDGTARPTAGLRGIADGLRFLVTQPVLALTEVLNELQNALAGWRRVLTVLDTPVGVADPGEDGVDLPPGPVSVTARAIFLRI